MACRDKVVDERCPLGVRLELDYLKDEDEFHHWPDGILGFAGRDGFGEREKIL